MERAWLSGAAWGPIVFIACWLVGGLTLPGYSLVDEPISRLAAAGAETRPLMNIGLAAFAVGVGTASWPLRRVLGPWAAAALGLNALMTVGVLATPLDVSPVVDVAHGVFAGIAYVALAAVGICGFLWLRNRTQRNFAWAWLVIGIVTGAALALSATDLAPGLLQRIGLTTTDVALIGIGFADGVLLADKALVLRAVGGWSRSAQAWVRRSRIMAIATIARPTSNPSPVSLRVTALTVSNPRPPPPTSPAMITMASTIMITWFTPSMIVGAARGIRTPYMV